MPDWSQEIYRRWQLLSGPYRVFSAVGVFLGLSCLAKLLRGLYGWAQMGVRPSVLGFLLYLGVLIFIVVWLLGMFRGRRYAITLSNVALAAPIFGWVYELTLAVLDYTERFGQQGWELPQFLLLVWTAVVLSLCVWTYHYFAWRWWVQRRQELTDQAT